MALSCAAESGAVASANVSFGTAAARRPDNFREKALVATSREPAAGPGGPTRRSFRKRHATGAATSAVTERGRVQHQDGPPRSKPAQPRRRGKARKAAANNGEIHVIRKRALSRTEINGPGRHAPWMRLARRDVSMHFAGHSISLMIRSMTA